MAANEKATSPNSAAIQAVECDEVDHDGIESRIQNLTSNTNVTRGFCDSCRHLLENWPDLTDGRDCAVAKTFHTCEIEAAARIGCKLCALLLSRINISELLDTFWKIERRLQLINEHGKASLSIQKSGDRSWNLSVNFPLKAGDHYIQAVHFESHTTPPAIARLYKEYVDPFELAKTWLSTCSSSHEHCRTKEWLEPPTRLVSIDHATGSIRLVLTASWETIPPYATLSYCWGNTKFTKLTTKNYDLYCKAIPLQDLPQTIRDAIHVTRTLGLEYIWIDALCIIQQQQDDSDWLRESGRMRSVYGGSYVNLAASSANSVFESLFCKPSYYNGGFYATVTSVNKDCTRQSFHSNTAYEESTTHTPLAQRAWAFQEKLLAPRTIHIGKHGLFWECRTTIKSEYLPDGVSRSITQSGSLLSKENEAWNWWSIVTLYSGTQLTYSSDRLPALAGIARRQHEITGDQYLAGMWRDGLIPQLGWYLEEPQRKKTRPKWRGPTWAWTAIDGQVTFWSFWKNDIMVEKSKNHIRVIDVWTTPSGPDRFGAVTGGELMVGCSGLVRGHLINNFNAHPPDSPAMVDSKYQTICLEPGMQHFPIIIDCLDEPIWQDESDRPLLLLPILTGETGFVSWQPGDGCEERYNERHETEWNGGKLIHELMIFGIVLQRLRGADVRGRFRRVGSFEFRRDCPLSSWEEIERYTDFMDIVNKMGAMTAQAECVRVDVPDDEACSELRYVVVIE